MMRVVPYDERWKEVWDTFVRESVNGTFLLKRDYMEYHADRFVDCSLLVLDAEALTADGSLVSAKGIKALMPANYCAAEATVCSHQGLTYGGLVVKRDVRQVEVIEAARAVADYYRRQLEAERLLIKPIPYIYNSYPNDAELYAWHVLGARLSCRNVSTVVDQSDALPLSTLRRRKVAHAMTSGITCRTMTTGDESHLHAYWQLLDEVLVERHQAHPVHSETEMRLLMERFPQHIRLHTAHHDGRLLAGVVVYETAQVAHVQYIASGEEGRRLGALDLLMAHLISDVYGDCRYFDMGRSMADSGIGINEGLVFQKEGFGGRTVCYDTYELKL